MSKTPMLDSLNRRANYFRNLVSQCHPSCKEALLTQIDRCKKWSKHTTIEKIFVNEAKRTVAVKFDNGDVMTSTCAKEDTFSVEVGIAMAISSYYCGGKKIFHSMVERASKQVKKPEQEVSVKPTQKKKSSKRVILNEGK